MFSGAVYIFIVQIVNWDTVIDYYVDGESSPSISLMEDMACGQGFPKAKFGTYNGNGSPWHGEAPSVGASGTFSAGNKMGKGGQVGGYYHYHKVLFQRSIRVTARTLGKGPQVVYIVVRGHEVPLPNLHCDPMRPRAMFSESVLSGRKAQRGSHRTHAPLRVTASTILQFSDPRPRHMLSTYQTQNNT